MSYCKKEDENTTLFFVTPEDEAQYPEPEEEPEEDRRGIVGPVNYDTKEIDWECPCLEHAIKGPCGEEFKAAFTCFSFSEAEPRGVDCIPLFTAMQRCQMDNQDYYQTRMEENEQEAAEEQADSPSETEQAEAPAAEPSSVETVAAEPSVSEATAVEPAAAEVPAAAESAEGASH